MKTNISTLVVFLVLTALFTSCKKDIDQTMTVVQDCTGLYLRIDGDDYRVCNLEKVASYADGATVIGSVRHIAECNDSAQNAFACLKLYPSHGWIEVLEIY